MSETKRKVPKLRFPGFTEDWEQRKFSEITVNIGKRNKENLNLEPYAITKDDGFIPQAEAHDEFGYMKETDRKAYNIVKPNSFGYNPARINVGSIGYYSGSEDIIVSSLYEIFQTSENIYDRFLWHWFKSKQFQNWIERLQEGSVRLYFYYDKLCECEIFIPTVDEQIKIGNSLDRLDNLITLHQRKLENLKLKKKALLQKLFPKNGEQFPELRFPGFTDAWEQRKLGEVIERFEYGLNASAIDYDGVHKYIRITDIDDVSHKFLDSNLTTPKIDFQNADTEMYKLKEGDILFARTGASVGKTYLYDLNDGDLYFAGFLIRGHVTSSNNANFVYQNTLTDNYDLFIKITSQRSGQPGVNSKEYAEFKLYIPSKAEQDKISSMLTDLDNLITLHQRKLEHLQLQKKALLQQMFV